jgi:hypothetical protein
MEKIERLEKGTYNLEEYNFLMVVHRLHLPFEWSGLDNDLPIERTLVIDINIDKHSNHSGKTRL